MTIVGKTIMNPNKRKINIEVKQAVTLSVCPPGLFLFDNKYGFRTEYTDENGPEAYCVESGEYFWGGAKNSKDRSLILVNPCIIVRS